MSNHLHLVLHVDQLRAATWTEADVEQRYSKLYPQAKAEYDLLPPTEQERRRKTWRSRLCNLSWMMRALNEFVARRANREDEVTGRFWEGRFKAQALLDDQGLLTCMAYVDLNPVRARLARTIEGSDFTSIQERLRDLARKRKRRQKRTAPAMLAPFADQTTEGEATLNLSATLEAYVELLEWTGRWVAKAERGKIVGPPPKLLTEHGLSADGWVNALAERTIGSVAFVGSVQSIDTLAKRRGKEWLRGIGVARRCAQ